MAGRVFQFRLDVEPSPDLILTAAWCRVNAVCLLCEHGLSVPGKGAPAVGQVPTTHPYTVGDIPVCVRHVPGRGGQ